jgi:very-short-patch-repair endonuclease
MKRLGKLKYDNEVPILKLIIEVNGLQHYEVVKWHEELAQHYNTTPEYEFWYQQEKDKYKKNFALSHGFEYLEIPYWTDNKEETWKNLIDEKIDGIIHNQSLKQVI